MMNNPYLLFMYHTQVAVHAGNGDVNLTLSLPLSLCFAFVSLPHLLLCAVAPS